MIINKAIEIIKKQSEPLEVKIISKNKKEAYISIYDNEYLLDIITAKDICGPFGIPLAQSIIYDTTKNTIKSMIRHNIIDHIINE